MHGISRFMHVKPERLKRQREGDYRSLKSRSMGENVE